MPERLTYHQATLDLLKIEPGVSPTRIAAVRTREKACGQRFPASVVEWYSLERAEDLYEEHTGGEWLTPLDELGSNADQIARGFLRVATENQGVVIWYVRLDEGDDPPVLGDSRAMADLEGVRWATGPHFSEFVYQMIAENR